MHRQLDVLNYKQITTLCRVARFPVGLQLHGQIQWASSAGLTAVSKCKPRLPAQWAVGTHRNGPSRTKKVTSRIDRPIRNSTEIRN